IIGWNLFSGSLTDYTTLTKIVYTWILCPFLAAGFGIVIYKLLILYIRKSRIHMIRIDQFTRIGLILVGAFGSYSLGANNIANVMGVFVPVSPFKNVEIGGIIFSSTNILFFFGALAISLGVITYSKKVMTTVGSDIFRLSPLDAFVVVLSSSLVLFIFASEGLKALLISVGLPSFPLVPVSSSQAVVGAILGIALGKGGKNINFGIMGKIGIGWILTPLVSGIITFILLFFTQNVFMQTVFN
ncbi:MAG: inorganic phosphate transporter, partial [Candidatus Aminicenantes bacterium]|nr:inorganic phosphate transporter [Candidatus Aminicenantes bacterium]